MKDERTYLIRRFCENDQHPDNRKVVKTGLTLDQAREHCNDPSTHGQDAERGAWFDGYNQEATTPDDREQLVEGSRSGIGEAP